MDIDKMLIEFRQLKDEWATFKAKYEPMLAESSVRYSAYLSQGQVRQPTKEELDKILNQTEDNVQVNSDGSTTIINTPNPSPSPA